VYAVRYSTRAASQLAEYKAMAEKSPDSKHGKLWSSIRRKITDVISDPDHATAPPNALRDDLRGTYRNKIGRIRIFYITSRKANKAAVLYIGWRKEGDKHDAYTEFARLLRNGEFDIVFKEIGVQLPAVCGRSIVWTETA
jgi:hypothetical protein